MRTTLLTLMLLLTALALPAALRAQAKETAVTNDLMTTVYENADGTTETLSQYAGKVILVVNTASKCGYTPQYADLESVYQKYKDQGFVVVAFPSNDFGNQEPGSNPEIQQFCAQNFKVTFPVKAKMPTKGDGKSPLYQQLTGETSPLPGEVQWNFEKFLISRDGKMIARYRSAVKPTAPEVSQTIEQELARKG